MALTRVRDLSYTEDIATPEVSSRTTTVYTPTGDPIQVPLLHIRCPRCLQTWEWPRGVDPDLDRQADQGVTVTECPECLDDLAELRLADFPWEEEW